MNPHAQRWITGLVAVPILFAIIAFGTESLFNALIAAAALVGISEYNRLSFAGDALRERGETFAGGLLILAAASLGQGYALAPVLTGGVLAVLTVTLWPRQDRPAEMAAVGRVLLGICYVPLLMSHFILIRQTQGAAAGCFSS
jgi:phosphatidate cytidylyltransferase